MPETVYDGPLYEYEYSKATPILCLSVLDDLCKQDLIFNPDFIQVYLKGDSTGVLVLKNPISAQQKSRFEKLVDTLDCQGNEDIIDDDGTITNISDIQGSILPHISAIGNSTQTIVPTPTLLPFTSVESENNISLDLNKIKIGLPGKYKLDYNIPVHVETGIIVISIKLIRNGVETELSTKEYKFDDSFLLQWNYGGASKNPGIIDSNIFDFEKYDIVYFNISKKRSPESLYIPKRSQPYWNNESRYPQTDTDVVAKLYRDYKVSIVGLLGAKGEKGEQGPVGQTVLNISKNNTILATNVKNVDFEGDVIITQPSVDSAKIKITNSQSNNNFYLYQLPGLNYQNSEPLLFTTSTINNNFDISLSELQQQILGSLITNNQYITSDNGLKDYWVATEFIHPVVITSIVFKMRTVKPNTKIEVYNSKTRKKITEIRLTQSNSQSIMSVKNDYFIYEDQNQNSIYGIYFKVISSTAGTVISKLNATITLRYIK